MFSVFLSSYRNTRESLGELEKAVETLTWGSCSHHIFRSPKLSLRFLYLDRNTVHVFYFLNINNAQVSLLMLILSSGNGNIITTGIPEGNFE